MTERSERITEEASYHLNGHYPLSHGAAFEQTTETALNMATFTGPFLVASGKTE